MRKIRTVILNDLLLEPTEGQIEVTMRLRVSLLPPPTPPPATSLIPIFYVLTNLGVAEIVVFGNLLSDRASL
jgi:hypothetical protein